MSFGSSSFGASAFGEGAAAASGPATLPAPSAAELSAESIKQPLGPIEALELSAEYLTDGEQVAGAAVLELSTEVLRVSLPAPAAAALNAEPLPQPLPAPADLELSAESMAPVLFEPFVPLILEAEVIYGVGAATWTTLSLTAVVGKKHGAIKEGSIVGVS